MALIRCSQCGNLASSRSAVCPICGNKIAAEQTTPPATESTHIVESAPEVEAPTEATTATQPKTLNEILAARQARATLNDMHAEATETSESADEESSTPVAGVGMGMTAGASYSSNDTSNNYEYNDNVRTVEEYEEEIRRGKRKAGGFMVGCIVLLIIIATLSVLYIKKADDYSKINESVKVLVSDANDRHELEADLLRSNAEDLVEQLEKYKGDNDSMAMRYEEAVKMLAELEESNGHTLDQLRRYQKEVETLKGIMRQYVRQIDSLNNVASTLKSENKTMKEQIKTQELLVSQAEERADELGTKVRQGSVIQVSAIKAYPLNANSKEVKKIKVAKRLRVDFELTANALAEPGEKSVYICIKDPDGYLMTSKNETIIFDYEGDEIMASAVRKVDYENNMVPVSIYYDSNSFSKGTYSIDIYIDGRHCGSAKQYFD